MKLTKISALVIVFTFLLAGAAWAQATDQKTLQINATVNAKANLTITPTTINFPDADPDATPSILANSTVNFTAKVRTGKTSIATLTVLANQDLTSGTDTIAITNVTWTATGTGFVNGTMNKTTAQNVASWTGSSTGPNHYTGICTYSLANSWEYATGNYTANAVYTLTAP